MKLDQKQCSLYPNIKIFRLRRAEIEPLYITMVRIYAGKIYAGKTPNLKIYAGIPPIPAYYTPEKDTMVLRIFLRYKV